MPAIAKRYSPWIVLLAAALVVFGGPVRIFAQAISGDITGVVTDVNNAVVVKADIVVKNEATGAEFTATTNAEGEFRVVNLPPGKYTISAVAQGFSKQVLREYVVELNKVSTANFSLKVKTTDETIEVSSEAGVTLDTTTAQLQTAFESEQLTQLPAATNNVLNLSLLTAGVASSGGVGAGSGPASSSAYERRRRVTRRWTTWPCTTASSTWSKPCWAPPTYASTRLKPSPNTPAPGTTSSRCTSTRPTTPWSRPDATGATGKFSSSCT